jgi:hypothetical protein
MGLFAAGRDEDLNRKMTNLKSSCDVARHARCGRGDQIQSASELVFPAPKQPTTAKLWRGSSNQTSLRARRQPLRPADLAAQMPATYPSLSRKVSRGHLPRFECLHDSRSRIKLQTLVKGRHRYLYRFDRHRFGRHKILHDIRSDSLQL